MQQRPTLYFALSVSLACASCASDASRSVDAEPSTTTTTRPTSKATASRTTKTNPRTGRPYETTLVEGEPMYTLLPKDRIRSIDAPQFLAASEAEGFMLDDEPVLGVIGADGTAKCYSAWHLDRHEIVNDTVDGHSIAATW